MKSSHKKLALVLIILSVLLVSFGCTPKVEPKIEEELTLNYGFFRGVDNDENSIRMGFAADGKNATLKVENKELLDSLVVDEFYLVAYNKDNVVKSMKVDPLLKEMVLKAATVIPIDDKDEIEIFAQDKVNVDNLTLLDESIFDFDKDGQEDKISMYTAAERDETGEIAWDDGQKWMIVAHSFEKDYILFDDYVQLGSIDFFVYTIDDNFYIDTMQVGTASLTHKTYAYDKEVKRFKMAIQYSASGNVNMIHSSSY